MFGCFADCDYFARTNWRKSSGIYQVLVSSAKKVGIRCVIFNNRGLGGVELKTPRTYCAANSDDLTEVVDYVKKIHPMCFLERRDLDGRINFRQLFSTTRENSQK